MSKDIMHMALVSYLIKRSYLIFIEVYKYFTN